MEIMDREPAKHWREKMIEGFGSDYLDDLYDELDAAKERIEKLETALEKISRERTLWGAMRKADHALGKFEDKALEGKDD